MLEEINKITEVGIAIVKHCRRTNSVKMVIPLNDLMDGDNYMGDWEVVIRRKVN